MKAGIFLVLVAAVLGWAWFGRGEGNVYAMTPDQVYAKLVSAKVEKGNGALFGKLDTKVSGNGNGTVYWNAGGYNCAADIAAEEGGKSRLTAYCGGASFSDGAAAGMLAGMHRSKLIEHIDATLDGRPFDAKLASGSTAAGWPKDARQPDGSLGAAAGEALKMNAEMVKMSKDFDEGQIGKTLSNEIRNAREQHPSYTGSGSSGSYGTPAAAQPMTRLP